VVAVPVTASMSGFESTERVSSMSVLAQGDTRGVVELPLTRRP
jgi:hypothetical protein